MAFFLETRKFYQRIRKLANNPGKFSSHTYSDLFLNCDQSSTGKNKTKQNKSQMVFTRNIGFCCQLQTWGMRISG